MGRSKGKIFTNDSPILQNALKISKTNECWKSWLTIFDYTDEAGRKVFIEKLEYVLVISVAAILILIPEPL